MILQLKEHYFAPMRYEAPIENTFFMGRNLADQSDRHLALFANNQHPMQLDCYEAYNQFLSGLNNIGEAQAAEADQERFAELKEQKSSTLAIEEGESLSTEDLSDIFMQVKSKSLSRLKTFPTFSCR